MDTCVILIFPFKTKGLFYTLHHGDGSLTLLCLRSIYPEIAAIVSMLIINKSVIYINKALFLIYIASSEISLKY